jgi:hypothetical protein
MLQGVGIIGYTFLDNLVGVADPHFSYGQIGIYGGVDKFTNTAAKPVTASKDNVIDGGFLEMGIERTAAFADYFRVRPKLVCRLFDYAAGHTFRKNDFRLIIGGTVRLAPHVAKEVAALTIKTVTLTDMVKTAKWMVRD